MFSCGACHFVLYRTCIVIRFYPIVGIFKIFPISCFIAKTPDNDAGVILQDLNIVFASFDVCLVIERILGKRQCSEPHTMTFQIRFRNHINAIFVAQVVPTRIVWIMACTDSIDVQFLSKLDVLNHPFHTHHIASIRVYLMTVHPFDKDRLAIDIHLFVLDFNLTETYILMNDFQYLSAFGKGCTQRI